jgi:hypothetical protein
MSKKRLNLDWEKVEEVLDFNPYLNRYKAHLVDIGLRTSTIESYVWLVKSYLEYADNNRPNSN